jgi:hypothetical protein
VKPSAFWRFTRAQDIGTKLRISWQKAKTVAIELDILNDEEYNKEIEVGSSTYKRYSGYALERIREAIEEDEVDPDETWEKHGW